MTIARHLQQHSGAFSPLSIAGCKLWLDGSDSATITITSSKVSAWADKSTSAVSFVQGTAANRPVVHSGAQNGRDAVTFNAAAATVLKTASGSPTVAQPFTLFHVAINTTPTTAGGGRILGNFADSNFQAAHSDGASTYRTAIVYAGGADFAKGPTDAYSTSVWGVSSYIVNGASTTAYVNGTAGSAFNAGSSSLIVGSLGIRGSSAALTLNGDIGEIIVYDTALSSTNRQAVEAYLKAKWGTP